MIWATPILENLHLLQGQKKWVRTLSDFEAENLLLNQLPLFFKKIGQAIVESVPSFHALEVNIGTLRSALHVRMARVHGQIMVLLDSIPIDKGLHGVVVNQFDLVHLMTGSETIKEVLHGNSAFH